MIPVTKVVTRPQSYVAVADVLRSGEFSSGQWVDRLERLISTVSRSGDAVAVSSGSVALMLALQAAGVDESSRVAVPAFTFSASAAAVTMLGAEPVFCDVDDYGLLTAEEVEKVGPVDAIMPVHLYGQLCNPASFDSFGVPVIEDAAQAIGAPIRNGAISFYGSKTVGAGEGGVVITQSQMAARQLRIVRNQGMRSQYEHISPGFNWRMSNLTAALVIGQMTGFYQTIKARKRNAEILWSMLAELPVGLPDPFRPSTWHLFTIQVKNREAVQEFLFSEGVESKVYYPTVLPDLDWFPDADVPNARRLANEVLSIPVHEFLTQKDVELVGDAVREAVKRCGSV